jgi:hypothetical protein
LAASLGIPLAGLAAYLETTGLGSSGGDGGGGGGYYDDYVEPEIYYPPPGGEIIVDPPRPGGDGGDGGGMVDMDGDGIPDTMMPAGLSPFQYLSGNVEYSPTRRGRGVLSIQHGGAKSGRRSARAAIVRQVMAERGVSLPQASRIVKEEGLF